MVRGACLFPSRSPSQPRQRPRARRPALDLDTLAKVLAEPGAGSREPDALAEPEPGRLILAAGHGEPIRPTILKVRGCPAYR